jgi:uncharacterized protein DUF4168
MLTVTKKAATFLKVAKAAEGAPEDAGIRIRRGVTANESKISGSQSVMNPIRMMRSSSKTGSVSL